MSHNLRKLACERFDRKKNSASKHEDSAEAKGADRGGGGAAWRAGGRDDRGRDDGALRSGRDQRVLSATDAHRFHAVRTKKVLCRSFRIQSRSRLYPVPHYRAA